MEKGSYNGRRVDFRNYTVARFNPHLFTGVSDAESGCGAAALALLTGISPRCIAMQNGSAHFSDRFMVLFLRRHGYAVQPLTLCNVSTSETEIDLGHVVLLSQLYRRNEATWGVVFSGIYYHNFCLYRLNGLSFLNKPTLSAYLISHSSWRGPQLSAVDQASSKTKLKA